MRSFRIKRAAVLHLTILTRLSLMLALTSLSLMLASVSPALSATTPAPKKPRASTGGVTGAHGTSGQLNAAINPNGADTSYFFQYGPTTAYGSQTPAVSVGAGTATVKVGQTVTNLMTGEHYRVVATNSVGTAFGKDKTFGVGKSQKKASRLKFDFPKGKGKGKTPAVVGYGGTYTLIGTMSGTGSANHPIALQTVAFPFTSPFTNIGAAVLTSPTGAFSFRIANLLQSTEFRLVTVGARPINSAVIPVNVAPRVTIHVRSGGHTGLARLYGTVTPGKTGAGVIVQILTPQKATSKREGPKPVAIGSTVLRKATARTSRFSAVVHVTRSGYYRVYVKLPKGPLVPGYSSDVFLRAPRGSSTTGKHKHRRKLRV